MRQTTNRFYTKIFKTYLLCAVACIFVMGIITSCPRQLILTPAWPVSGKSVEGRDLKLAQIGGGSKTIFLFGVIHGDEPAGKTLLAALIEYAAENPDIVADKKLLIMPVANPDGLDKETRVNANGVDLNRNFPSKNWNKRTTRKKYAPGEYPASEPETLALIKIIEQKSPDMIISIHQPLECINYDGPAMNYAAILARATGLPLKNDIGYNTPGSLGTYAGIDRGIPTITIELPENVTDKNIADIYLPALIEVIRTF